MKQLILMRHAKSDWSGGPSSDHDRPLNPRGRRAAAALGDWLRAHDLIPDLVLCSSAIRTRETCVRLALPPDVAVEHIQHLYLASAETILTTLQKAQAQRVLMIGHNPGIGMMAESILTSHPDHPQFMQYPTGATLVVDFEIEDWAQAARGKATARHFIVPREL
ncbi:MAG: histidine phosphatase family protein [Sulfitobacter sp.]